MENFVRDDQDGFLIERLERGLAEGVCIAGKPIEALGKSERRVRIQQIDPILNR